MAKVAELNIDEYMWDFYSRGIPEMGYDIEEDLKDFFGQRVMLETDFKLALAILNDKLIKSFETKIEELQKQKEKYIKEEDQYSFWVVDDEQEIWKKAKKLAVDHSLKKQTGTPAPEQ